MGVRNPAAGMRRTGTEYGLFDQRRQTQLVPDSRFPPILPLILI
jgi:hypothetical protein